MTTQLNGNRYSEADLAAFKIIIETKLEKAELQLSTLEIQLADTTESKDNEGDWMDDSSINTNIEMLEVMVQRQRRHLIDLQNAMLRIHNKSYGICTVTRTLIDKKRLMAVPTTTKSLAAKVNSGEVAFKKTIKTEAKPKASKGPKIFSRIIRKSDTILKPKEWEDDEDEDLDLDFDDDLDLTSEIDLDSYSEEDIED